MATRSRSRESGPSAPTAPTSSGDTETFTLAVVNFLCEKSVKAAQR